MLALTRQACMLSLSLERFKQFQVAYETTITNKLARQLNTHTFCAVILCETCLVWSVVGTTCEHLLHRCSLIQLSLQLSCEPISLVEIPPLVTPGPPDECCWVHVGRGL